MISKPKDSRMEGCLYPDEIKEIDILKDPEIFINIISGTSGNHKVVVWDPERKVWKTYHKGADKKPVPGESFSVWTDKIKSDLKGE